MNKQETINEQAAEIDSLRAQLRAAKDGLASLDGYVASAKFSSDPTVQTGDITARLREIRSAMLDAEFIPMGWASAVRVDKSRNAPVYGAIVPDYSRPVYHVVR